MFTESIFIIIFISEKILRYNSLILPEASRSKQEQAEASRSKRTCPRNQKRAEASRRRRTCPRNQKQAGVKEGQTDGKFREDPLLLGVKSQSKHDDRIFLSFFCIRWLFFSISLGQMKFWFLDFSDFFFSIRVTANIWKTVFQRDFGVIFPIVNCVFLHDRQFL